MPKTLWHEGGAPVSWTVSKGLAPYPDALVRMKESAAAIAAGDAPETVWLLEHPPLYTAGTSAKPEDVRDGRFPVFAAGRGGQTTYHGPGQRVAYVMLDLSRRGRDIRCFVHALEGWIIDALGGLGVEAARRKGRIGVWVPRPDKGPGREDKIAAIGVRVSRWVSFHGISLNVSPDLTHYEGIVPCGIIDQGVTSLADLGAEAAMDRVDAALRSAFEARFGPTLP